MYIAANPLKRLCISANLINTISVKFTKLLYGLYSSFNLRKNPYGKTVVISYVKLWMLHLLYDKIINNYKLKI